MTLIFITLRHYYTHARRRPVSRVSMVERCLRRHVLGATVGHISARHRRLADSGGARVPPRPRRPTPGVGDASRAPGGLRSGAATRRNGALGLFHRGDGDPRRAESLQRRLFTRRAAPNRSLRERGGGALRRRGLRRRGERRSGARAVSASPCGSRRGSRLRGRGDSRKRLRRASVRDSARLAHRASRAALGVAFLAPLGDGGTPAAGRRRVAARGRQTRRRGRSVSGNGSVRGSPRPSPRGDGVALVFGGHAAHVVLLA